MESFMSEEKSSGRGLKPMSIFICALASLLVFYNIYRGVTVKKLGLPGFEVEFGEQAVLASEKKVEQLGDSELKARQAKLEQQMQAIQSNIPSGGQGQVGTPNSPQTVAPNAAGVTGPDPVSASPALNLTGTWQMNDDTFWVVEQRGSILAVEERHPQFGVVATGTGRLVGRQVTINYQTVLGTVGEVQFEVSGDGNELTGRVYDRTTGATSPFNAYRGG
jgi:hypothetical protein